MRLLVVLLLLVSAGLSGSAQRYQVFRCSEGTMVRHRHSPDWEQAVRRDSLALFDFVRIPENGSFAVLDAGTNRIYRNVSSGEMPVKELIDQARREADRVAGQLKRELVDGGQAGKSGLYSSVGAVSRGQASLSGSEAGISVEERHDLLADGLAGFVGEVSRDGVSLEGCHGLNGDVVGEMSGTGVQTVGNLAGQIVLEAVPVGEDEAYFRIRNYTDRDLCVNVLMCDLGTGRLSLCYLPDSGDGIVNLFVAEGAALDMSGYVFLYPEAGTGSGGTGSVRSGSGVSVSDRTGSGAAVCYIPFGADFEFDSWFLQNLLQNYSRNSESVSPRGEKLPAGILRGEKLPEGIFIGPPAIAGSTQ